VTLNIHLKRVLPYRLRQGVKRALGRQVDPVAVCYDSSLFPFLGPLESEWRSVRRELDTLGANRFFDWPSDHHRGGWTAFGFYAMRRKIGENCELCPETTRLIEQIPDLVTAGFSVLTPGTRILPHRDASHSTLRCHLGLITPEGCRMRLGGTMFYWREGKCMVFDSTIEHEVWHKGSSPRVVLLIDFLKPGMAYDYRFAKSARPFIPDTAKIPKRENRPR